MSNNNNTNKKIYKNANIIDTQQMRVGGSRKLNPPASVTESKTRGRGGFFSTPVAHSKTRSNATVRGNVPFPSAYGSEFDSIFNVLVRLHRERSR